MNISKSKFKNIFAYLLITIILLHFLKNLTPAYTILLSLLILLSTLSILFSKYHNINFTTTTFSYSLFLASLLYIVILTLINFFKFELNITHFIIANSKMWVTPLIPFFLYGLISSKEKITYIVNIYILFIFVAALSIFLQNILGYPFDFLSPPYNKMRMGHENMLDGYASLTGNVTTYGASFYSAIILIFFNKLNYPFLKALSIALIIGAAILTMSKTGLLMAIITAILIFILSIKYMKFKFLFYLFIIALIGAITFNDYFISAFITMFVNTFGIEIGNVNISSTTQWQAFIPRVTDRIFGVFFINSINNYSFIEIFFGIGMFGAGGLLGFNAGTSHNTFFDLYLMGGFIPLFIFLYLFICTQLDLYKIYKKNKDQLTLAFFFNNLLLFVVLNVFNGAIFHPAISTSFWISIAYLMFYNKNEN